MPFIKAPAFLPPGGLRFPAPPGPMPGLPTNMPRMPQSKAVPAGYQQGFQQGYPGFPGAVPGNMPQGYPGAVTGGYPQAWGLPISLAPGATPLMVAPGGAGGMGPFGPTP